MLTQKDSTTKPTTAVVLKPPTEKDDQRRKATRKRKMTINQENNMKITSFLKNPKKANQESSCGERVPPNLVEPGSTTSGEISTKKLLSGREVDLPGKRNNQQINLVRIMDQMIKDQGSSKANHGNSRIELEKKTDKNFENVRFVSTVTIL